MDAKRHATCVEEYRTRWLPRYQALGQTLEAVLLEASRHHAPLGMVQVRAKGVSSFAEKIIRKPYDNPFLEMTDLCGGRVITVTAEHVRAVSDFIKASFDVDYENSLDVAERLGTSEFGYRSVHYIVQFRPGRCLGVPVPRQALPSKNAPMKSEIQVRTVIQHAWAAVVHDRIYKSSIRVPETLRRDAARLAALLEEADGVVSHVVDDIDAYVVDIGAHMPRERVLEELDRLDVVLRGERDAGTREELAVRAAKLCRALADWPTLEDRLRPFVRTTRNADLLREYGNALCQRHADRPGGRDYLLGQAALARALELSPNAPDTHAMLAESCERQPRAAARAREHFRHAHQLAPGNPYHFTAHLEHELLRDPSGSLVPVLEPAIRRALATCARHVQVGIELPRAYMTMGKLHLFLGETYASLDACAKGLRMALDPSSGVCSACLGRELDVLCRLDTAREGLAGDPGAQGTLLESLRRMLLAGLWLAKGQRR
ncbi:MAG TPA: RelA/SpoT domain-containing protein, partial [Candidatus Hydrogenedentes bacterium]|nr:RelA/SpoT domain-containing protein [Candidatus Hydrogenedentota bacterium]